MTPLKTAVTKKLRRKYLEGSVSLWNENVMITASLEDWKNDIQKQFLYKQNKLK